MKAQGRKIRFDTADTLVVVPTISVQTNFQQTYARGAPSDKATCHW